MKSEYLVIVETSEHGFAAYVPDLPGCVAVADSRERTLALIRGAIEMHVESLHAASEEVPPPTSTAERVVVNVAAR